MLAGYEARRLIDEVSKTLPGDLPFFLAGEFCTEYFSSDKMRQTRSVLEIWTYIEQVSKKSGE